MQPQKLFRKAAIDKLSSPEQLDLLMQVTSPAGWLALAALGVILAGAVLWGFAGRISIKVDGRGILMRGAVLDVTSGAAGQVAEVLVRPGAVVEKGQVVARLAQADLELQIRLARDRLQAVRAQGAIGDAQTLALIGQYEEQARGFRERLRALEDLNRRGLATGAQVLQARQTLAQVDTALAQLRTSSSGRRISIADIEGEIEQLESRLAATSAVRSPYAGRVLERMADPGNLVAPGSRILTLEALDTPIESVVYVPAGEGKKVKPGMVVRISPSTVKVEEYGFLIGEVSSVSDFPVTPEGLRRVLRNESLVAQLTGEGAPIEVVARLLPDSTTPSGYRWSSSQGPPSQIVSGTVCTAAVVVEERQPVSYVLPALRRAVGAG